MFEDEAGLYSERPEWRDVVPLEQYENVNPLAPILYADQYKDATNYFRGIVKTAEKSPRVLDLTEHLIRLNPAHYSAWQYRYDTLLALNASLEDELRLMDPIAVRHLKNYQVWHHRRLLLTKLGQQAAKSELTFIAQSLKVDSKNYHTWSYRQWLLSYFNDDDLWEHELDFTESMIIEDVRNNSAWHHRFFVVWQSGVREPERDRQHVCRRELIYVKQNISLAPNNPSAWNYLRGMLDHTSTPYSSILAFVEPYTKASSSTANVVDLENPPPSQQAELPCPAALEFVADIYQVEGGDATQKANAIWRSLADEHDTIRRRYWEHRIKESMTPA